ncbi:transglutaminase-like domain-containing protein [Roseivivax sediminis]|uniref:Transglutaminase-like enzyme, putative cysteine protease n=1 Tax=Roseivivax sediminis TaxID=936889 RepID=A0A1I1VZK4_9RHOB|nr:transglutaminase family protein [Roseivivax sediminis]SFD88245.1 Transglutaminase-like enzyme, putative cysteine protease [Roseivivax sediminis]
MQVSIDLGLTYSIGPSRTVLLAIEAARCGGQSVLHDNIAIEEAVVHRIEGESGLGTRIWARLAIDELRLRYRAEVDVTRPAPHLERHAAAPLPELPAEAFGYLRPSRFCQSDQFGSFANKRFGGLSGGAKVAAIRDWVATEIAYVPASSDAGTTALDTFARREGVCRDFAHMVCALARAAGIPARYASAYAPGVEPPDFHAVAEVWLDDGWHLVDPTGMSTEADAVLIGVGRDACDAPFMETVDDAQPIAQSVTVRYSG